MIWAAVVSAIVVAIYIWQDALGPHGIDLPCYDGNRYTSGTSQPYPFHRRFCGWNRTALVMATTASLVALGAMMGTWKQALLLMTLPGAWFISIHKTTVDAPSMLLAYGASLVMPYNPWVAMGMSCLSGFIHERGPVFAALYAWNPFLLIGLACVGWWRKPASADHDKLVGRGLWDSLMAHKPYTDWLDWVVPGWGLRGLIPIAAYSGVSYSAWASLAVAFASRAVGTDGARFLWWAAPALVRDMPDAPVWMVAAHVMAFRRIL